MPALSYCACAQWTKATAGILAQLCTDSKLLLNVSPNFRGISNSLEVI